MYKTETNEQMQKIRVAKGEKVERMDKLEAWD